MVPEPLNVACLKLWSTYININPDICFEVLKKKMQNIQFTNASYYIIYHQQAKGKLDKLFCHPRKIKIYWNLQQKLMMAKYDRKSIKLMHYTYYIKFHRKCEVTSSTFNINFKHHSGRSHF
jgi:hypothetical protein